MKMRTMKVGWKMAPVTALFFSFAITGQASADTLGNTLANKLCGGSDQTYRLTTAQLAQWTGLNVNGAYSTSSAVATIKYDFYKAAHDDNAAICKKSSKTSSGTDCQQRNVIRSGRVLTKSTSSTGCD
jgi:hypothetical protein